VPRPALPLAIAAQAALPALALAATAQSAPRATCHGFAVTTPKSSGTIVGTNRRDVIRLTGPGANQVLMGDDARARENGLMATEDVVLSGSRGISIIAEGPALENLLMSNTSVAFDWIPSGGLAEQMMGLGLAWQVVRPWMMNVVTVDDRAGAFWASPGSEPMPGSRVNVMEQAPVTWGARMALVPTGVLLGVPGGTSNAVEVMNQVGGQNVVGLSIGGSANGDSAVNPAFAVPLPAWSIAPFRQPTSLRLRTANPGTEPGQWLLPPSPGQQQATVTFGGGQSIATFRVMPDGSFLRG